MKRQQLEAPKLLHNTTVRARLKELQAAVASPKIMDVADRKKKLSEIVRAKVCDFMGQDGSLVNIGPETPNSEAIQEIRSRTKYDDKGVKRTVYTSVKLYDKLEAIQQLNKMEHSYSKGDTADTDNHPLVQSLQVVFPDGSVRTPKQLTETASKDTETEVKADE